MMPAKIGKPLYLALRNVGNPYPYGWCISESFWNAPYIPMDEFYTKRFLISFIDMEKPPPQCATVA